MKSKTMWQALPLLVAFLICLSSPAWGQTFAQFQATTIESNNGSGVTAVTLGPDNNLYFQEQDGDIFRHVLDQSTGRPTGSAQLLFDGNDAAAIGLTFTPNATAGNLEAVVTYAESFATDPTGVSVLGDIVPGVSNVARLTLPSVGDTTLATRTDIITGLNVGSGTHSANQPVFGPDGRLYWNQGSVSGGGSQEVALSAATLVADILDPNFQPIDVTAPSFDPFATDSPIEIFATGVRNAYDLVFHTNGNLYTGINANDGPDPTPDNPATPQNESVNDGRPDETVALLEEGGFFGHPNAVRGEFIPFGGNPTSGNDPFQINNLPVGTQPNPNFDPALNFNVTDNQPGGGTGSVSPNGIAEFTAATGLQGQLLVAHFGGEIQTIELDENGLAVGFGELLDENGDTLSFQNPLDLVVDENTGRIFVGGNSNNSGSITLLTPLAVVAATVPEPSSFALLSIGALAALSRRRRATR